MLVGLAIKMLYVLVLCPVLLAGGAQTLTIDSELGTSIEDCFERISIGEQLPRDAIYRNVSELTTRECEQICKQDKQCQSYDYGVGAKGNATCNLSNANEKEIKEKSILKRHPDYDVYVRRFQCEQSPPSPIEPQFDDPTDPQEDRPIQHRPVFRPVDDKQSYADDYLVSSDLASYGVKRPIYRPQYAERPDDYTNQKPEYDSGPSYGGHKPQDIPYTPEKPHKKPAYNPRPDPYDELYIQEPYRPARPGRPGYQEEERPYRRPLVPEKLEYQYITRPKPKPEDTGYGFQRPADGYSPDKDHGRPRPTTSNQYATNYGQNVPYDSNYIHVEIRDPPYYYDKRKPSNEAVYGYGSYASQNSYSQQSSYQDPSYSSKPSYTGEKPAYSQSSYGSNQGSYGQSDYSNQGGYGSNDYYGTTTVKPINKYKPTYGNFQMPSLDPYGNQGSYTSNQGGYGSNQSSQGSSYGSKPNERPYMHTENERPSNMRPSYEIDEAYGQKPSYNSPGYGNNPSDNGYGNKPSYDSDRPGYATEKPYSQHEPGYQKPSYDLPGYEKPGYEKPGYEKPGYEKPGYEKPGYAEDKPYNDQRVGHNKPGYDQPSYSNQDTYGDSLGTYGGSQYYGSNQQTYQASYSDHSTGNRPTVGSYLPTLDHTRPTIDLYGNRPANSRPSYNQQSQNRPSYSNQKPNYHADDSSGYGGNSPAYDENRPDFPEPDDPGYGNSDSGYGKPNKTGVKPVYEYELEKPDNVPSYIARPGGQVVTSRPMSVGDYPEPDYGRHQTKLPSYEACFRRVLAGKRALRSHVRKVSACERLDDCRRECATEKRFPCESFNYRMDRSFRGKGLCELMTKPIEAFDLRRDFVEDKDFDFFERDRNSLEPNCPDKLRGPGLLHSGYLSSKPERVPEREGGWRDRDWDEDRHRDRFGDRRGGYNRYDNRFYIPYQINHGIARSNEDDSWGQYGGDYGGTDRYYKDRNDYHKSVSHWRLASDINRPAIGVKPISNTNFDYNTLGKGEGPWTYGYGSWKRGRWNSSGSHGLEYGESNFYKPKSHFHGVNEHGHDPIDRNDDGPVKDCSSRRRPGMSLGSGAIRRSLLFRNVVECEAACFNEREFKCVSYSFRYSSAHGTDNCFLSERPYRGLELSADSSSDVYAMPQDQGCVTINYTPWVESECFWHVRSGAVVSDSAVRAALTVAGLGACEAECIRAHDFFCRGFSFRFDAPTIGDDIENCILTSSPPTSLNSGRGLRPNSGHELYARGNYGRGCEPALYDDTQQREDECYLQYDKAAKLTGSAIRGQARVKDEQSCGHACNEAPFTCLSFSFNNNAPPNTDNCLLSEIRLFDLKRGVDYVHSEDDWLFAFDLFNGQCWRKVHAHHFDDSSPEVPRPLSAPPIEDPYSSSGPSGPPGPPGITGPSGLAGPEYPLDHHHDPPFIPSGPPSGPGYKPDPPRYPPASDPGFPAPISPGYKPHYPPGPSHIPGYSSPSGTDFKPGYPGPTFKPEYHEPSGPAFKPGFKPSFSDPPTHGFKPGYPGPSFKPGYPEPSGPDYKPGYPGNSFRPGDSGPSGPDFDPGYPGPLPGFKPSYPGASGPGYKPGFPADDTLILKPGYSGIDSNFKPGYPSFKPDYPVRPPSYKPGYLPEPDLKPSFRPPGPQRPAQRPLEPDYIPGKPGYLPEKPGYRPERPGYPGPNRPLLDIPKPGRPAPRPGIPDREISEPISSWRHYTVSGFPCRAGSSCAQNHVAGHWACEPEGGEIGSWDYCCVPSHRCGYSEGFHKPWCYVGPSEDQWRPCSEKYYPYHQHKVPHPSQAHQPSPGHREPDRPPQRPWDRPTGQPAGPPLYNDRPLAPAPPVPAFDRPQGPYLSQADKRYWDDLYKNGPQAYYDKFGNPLPGYSRVPTEERPHIKYSHHYPQPGTGQWQQLPQDPGDRPPPALGVPRYWPVAYLHKGPPPNTTYFRYNETEQPTTTERLDKDTTTQREQLSTTTVANIEKHRDEKQRNISAIEDNATTESSTVKTKDTTTEVVIIEEEVTEKENRTEVETVKPVSVKIKDVIKGIDDKLDDFSSSIEVLDLDDVKGNKVSELKTLEAEERQIEEIGRILASRRGGKLVLDKRSQKDLEAKNIAVNDDFNFGNKFNVERRGVVQKVSKDEIERERAADKSLEVSETAFVRPPRVLSTTENIRKAIVNGRVFYDATLRDQRESFLTNATRRNKSLKNADESRLPNITTAANFGKKIVLTRNVNPVRRVRRVYRKRYNPDEVRRRLLEREKSKQEDTSDSSRNV